LECVCVRVCVCVCVKDSWTVMHSGKCFTYSLLYVCVCMCVCMCVCVYVLCVCVHVCCVCVCLFCTVPLFLSAYATVVPAEQHSGLDMIECVCVCVGVCVCVCSRDTHTHTHTHTLWDKGRNGGEELHVLVKTRIFASRLEIRSRSGGSRGGGEAFKCDAKPVANTHTHTSCFTSHLHHHPPLHRVSSQRS